MIYLDNAATSFPKPAGMAEAMMEHMVSWCGNPGRAGHRMSRRTEEAVYNTRKILADFFKISDPARILFTHNTTEALNLAIKGTLKPGDHVITTSMEHNSVLRPLLEYQPTIIECGKDGSLDISKVTGAIRSNTRMIVCTHASNVTGTIMPIKELAGICRRHKLLLLVDAAQSAGHLPVDVEGVELMAVPGHKGLLGPMGTGILYVKSGLEIVPLIQGGTGTYSKLLDPPVEFPASFEAGTLNAPGLVGLGYSVRYLMKIGPAEGRIRELTKYLDEMLRNMKNVTVYGPEDCRSKVGIVTFNVAGRDCEEVASLLDDSFGIAVRSGYHCAGLAHKTIGTWDTGAVRLSVGIFNSLRQMRAAADAVYRISKLHQVSSSSSAAPAFAASQSVISGCRHF